MGVNELRAAAVETVRRAPAGAAHIDRRELLLWGLAVAAVSFLVRNYLLEAGAARFALFECLGFIAAAKLVASAHARPATGLEIVATIAGAALAACGPFHAAGASLTLLAVIAAWPPDVHTRAAGVVMLSLAGRQLWSKIVFAAAAPEIVKIDAALVGFATTLFVPGATWSGNVISTRPGFSIVVEDGCSSFSNVSLAILCYCSVSRLERPDWRRGDLWVIASACGAQILLNVGRIYMMAQSPLMFEYWHNGVGSEIYTVVAAISAVLMSAIGTRLAARS